MKRIECWDDLRPHGILALTGESCALSYRVLCDVTARGKAVIEKCLGCELTLPGNWNSGARDDPPVGSLMLAHELLIPLAIFALLESGCPQVWLVGNAVLGIDQDDAQAIERLRQYYGEQVRRVFSYGPHGDRNLHQFTGRLS